MKRKCKRILLLIHYIVDLYIGSEEELFKNVLV